MKKKTITHPQITGVLSKQFLKRAGDIIVPDKLFHPIRTDNVEIDGAFSELRGIIPSQVVLMTGTPGSGKTTLASVIASRAQRSDGRPAVFLSYEMSDFQLKLQAKKFLVSRIFSYVPKSFILVVKMGYKNYATYLLNLMHLS